MGASMKLMGCWFGLLLTISLSHRAVAQNISQGDWFSLIEQCQNDLNQCLYNNTQTLNDMAPFVSRIPSSYDKYVAFVYTIIGPWVSAAGIGITLFCDSCSSWYFSMKSEKKLVEKINRVQRHIIDEIRKNKDESIRTRLEQYEALIFEIVKHDSLHLDPKQTQKIINDYIDSLDEGQPINLEDLKVRLNAEAT